jgi:hypothetical protein
VSTDLRYNSRCLTRINYAYVNQFELPWSGCQVRLVCLHELSWNMTSLHPLACSSIQRRARIWVMAHR